MIMEPGRVCVKLAGREAGKKCVVVETSDKNFVVVLGEGVRRRRCNITHLEPTSETIKIKKSASDESILKTLK
ncbi:50S ribosomal protein L14e [archaeon BMS3Abin16]|nr:50S ribosomal protein L14e [archaeon BMS3Abin16]GBE57088.1 50S ribosomal protein L14e [archaeon BMS3Bbin16]